MPPPAMPARVENFIPAGVIHSARIIPGHGLAVQALFHLMQNGGGQRTAAGIAAARVDEAKQHELVAVVIVQTGCLAVDGQDVAVRGGLERRQSIGPGGRCLEVERAVARREDGG